MALAAFLWHLLPVFLRFKGGKGVAAALGVLLALNVWLGLCVLATWLMVALLFRFSSLAALTAAAGAPTKSPRRINPAAVHRPGTRASYVGGSKSFGAGVQ